MSRLLGDLDTGAWQSRYSDLCERSELDVGLRLVVAEID
jgi:hypothetical protein